MIQSQPIMHYILIAVQIIFVIALGYFAYLLIRRSLNALSQRRHISEPLRIILSGLIRWLIIIIVILVALQQIGVKVASI